MRGRAQASCVAMLGSLVPVISPATVGLVTLRKGSTEGFLVSLWAVLPVMLGYAMGGFSPLLSLVTIAGLLLTVVSANVLRATISWELTLLALLVISALVALLMGRFAEPQVEQFSAQVVKMLTESKAPAEIQFVSRPEFLVSMAAWVMALGTVVSLLLARWWQALLYNPGGFRQEMHNLRISKRTALILGAIAILGMALPAQYMPWSELAGLPLLVAGIALVHYVIAVKQLGGHWLGLMYFGVLFIGPVSYLLTGLGLADSLLNFRSRINGGNTK